MTLSAVISLLRPSRLARSWVDLAVMLDPVRTPAEMSVRGAEGWLDIYRLATAEFVAPALYAKLAAHGCLSALPEDVRSALELLWERNDQRNQRLLHLLLETVRTLNAVGIEPVLLKGAIALLPDQYPYAFARMMSDLDIGVLDDDCERAAEALLVKGYFHPPPYDPLTHAGDYHLAPLCHPDETVGTIEIHRRLLPSWLATDVLALDKVLANARRCELGGAAFRIPAHEDRLLHNALHQEMSPSVFSGSDRSLRQLLEFVQLCHAPDAVDMDWADKLNRLDAEGRGDLLRTVLLAASRLFAQPVPCGVRHPPAVVEAEDRFWRRLGSPMLDRYYRLGAGGMRLARAVPRLVTDPMWRYRVYRILRYNGLG